METTGISILIQETRFNTFAARLFYKYPRKAKNPFMDKKTWINRMIILSFMVLVGFSLANAINSRSFIAIVLALVSLGSGIYFLYILAKVKEEANRENAV